MEATKSCLSIPKLYLFQILENGELYVQKNQVQIHIFSRFSLSDRSWGKKDWLKSRDFTCLWDIAQIVYIMYDGLTNMRRSSKIRVKNVLKISILCKYINWFNNAAAFWFNFYNKKKFPLKKYLLLSITCMHTI